MFNSNGAPSIADIAAVTRGNGNGYNNGFGGEGWWALIILLALFGGWGDYGFGGAGRAGSAGAATLAGYVTQADLQRGFDTQAITNKLNGLENGMASLGYDQLAQMNTLGAGDCDQRPQRAECHHDDRLYAQGCRHAECHHEHAEHERDPEPAE